MKPSYIELTYGQVAIAGTLILVNGLFSLALRLGLEGRLLIAAGRMVGQLILIGFVLGWVFSVGHWSLVLALASVMVVVAAGTAVRRPEKGYPGVWIDGLVSIWVSSWVITAVALGAVIRHAPWYAPQYAIPLLGMLLGNSLNGVSLGLDRFAGELASQRDRVDALLALGATRWEAARPWVRRAIRTGMIPILNSMSVAGIVNLPGMMTGQLLAGVPPAEAVKYQVVIYFLIASATALGTVGVVLLGYRRLFNARHQFLYSRLGG
jgi:putative ABC transport system permease protein